MPGRLAGTGLLALALLAGCNASGEGGGTGSAFSQLHRDGRWLKDLYGRTVLIHGVNAVWKLSPYAPPDTAEGFTAADADWLAAHGFNGVRLGVVFAGVMPQPGVVDRRYLDRVVRLLASRGVYVLFDFHQDMYTERYQGEGFPDWATIASDADSTAVLGFPANYFLPVVSEAFERFWNDENGLWDDYTQAWEAVAARWADQGYNMGYDLMNEPWPGTQWPLCLVPLGCPTADARMQQAYEAFRAGIRAADGGNIVWYEPQQFFNDGIASTLGATPVDDAQLGFSYHSYCLLDSLSTSIGVTIAPACGVLEQLVFANAAATRDRLGAASLMTEFGATDNLDVLARIAGEADAALEGWMYWQYKNWSDPTTQSGDSGAQGLFDDDADLTTAKTGKLAVLERTYPQATAGQPVSLSYDPDSGDFEYHYIATPGASGTAAITEIHVPSASYPEGYQVTLTGAEQLSASGATLLRVRNLAGAGEVVVQIAAPLQ
ncbi:MAG: cellulase family glycosylhydrolase [Solimonas sp.]